MNVQANTHKGQRASPPTGASHNAGVWGGREGSQSSAASEPRLLLHHHRLHFPAAAFAGKNDNLGSLHPDPHALSPGSNQEFINFLFFVYTTFSKVRAGFPQPQQHRLLSVSQTGAGGFPRTWAGVVIKILTFTYYKMYIFLTDQRRDYFLLLKMLFYSKVLNIGSFFFFNRYNIQKEL